MLTKKPIYIFLIFLIAIISACITTDTGSPVEANSKNEENISSNDDTLKQPDVTQNSPVVNTPLITSIHDLPMLTDPIISRSDIKSLKKLATKGLKLKDAETASIESRGLCLSTTVFRTIVLALAGLDHFQCGFKVLSTYFEDDGVDPYDGKYHYLYYPKIDEKFKFRVTKDQNNGISNFELFNCIPSEKTDKYEQRFHFLVEVEENAIHSNIKGAVNNNGKEDNFSLTFDGIVNSDLMLTEKKIKMGTHTYDESIDNFLFTYSAFQQTPNVLFLKFLVSVELPSLDDIYTFKKRSNIINQIIDNPYVDVYDIGELALGDGSGNSEESITYKYCDEKGECVSQGALEHSLLESWSGDTFAPVEENDFTHLDKPLPEFDEMMSQESLKFNNNEKWDCELPEKETITLEINADPVVESCSNYILDWESELDCQVHFQK